MLTRLRHEQTDPAIFREMGELGLLGPTIPEAHGGAGLNYVCYGLIAREVERIDSGYRMMSVQSSLVMVPINEFGNAATKQKYLPKLASGESIGCFGLTEPNHGSDPGSMITRARKVDGGYALSGRRCGSATARSPTCSSSGPRTRAARSAASCSKRAEGPSAPAIHGKVSACASITGEIVMDGVFCPRRTPSRGARPEGPVHLPEQRALRHRLGRAGRAEDCWHARASTSLDRQQFGRPLAANQLVQKKLADMLTDITLGLQGPAPGRMKDEGTAAVEITSIMKRNSCGKALDIAAHGARHDGRQRHQRRVRRRAPPGQPGGRQHHEGTHDIHALILGRAITGIQAFRPCSTVPRRPRA